LAIALGVCLQTPAPDDPLARLENAVAAAIEKAAPSVVAITRTKGESDEVTVAVRGNPVAPRNPEIGPGLRNEFPFPLQEARRPVDWAQPGEFGSGVVIGDHGEILTVFHLLQGATSITVRSMATGGAEFEAEILAADPRSDLAVIAPRMTPGQPMPKLPPLPLGDASKLRQGSFLIALGNAYNAARDDGRPSAGWGILSNTSRRIVPPAGEDPQVRQYLRHQPTLMQLDSKLNLGMSGGAVVNLAGELVGITTDAASPAGFDVQAGYAIPLDALGRRIVETLREGREMEYGFMGIKLHPLLPNAIGAVDPGTPAANADLLAEDIIVGVGGHPVDDRMPLSLALSLVPVGKPVKIRYIRDGEEGETEILISKYPLIGEVIATTRPDAWRGIRVDFASVLGGGRDLGALAKGGVGVIEVAPSSPAENAGLKRGMVITAVGSKRVRTPEEFRAEVRRQKGPVSLTTEMGPTPGTKITVPE
jgi:S1-C subfamily serine protease